MEITNLNSQTKKIATVIIVGMMVIIIAIITSILFEFSIVANVTMSWILTTAYALFTFFMVEPIVSPMKYIEKPLINEVVRYVEKIVEKPVIKEIQIPMENKTIEVVEMPVIKEVIRYIERPTVKIERPIKKLNIQKFEFIGSIQTKKYHKRSCKFSKMLKRKYKLHSNQKSFFEKKHYKACKTCLKNNRKNLLNKK